MLHSLLLSERPSTGSRKPNIGETYSHKTATAHSARAGVAFRQPTGDPEDGGDAQPAENAVKVSF